MEHKPLIERLWGIVRTHSFAVFESCLQQACPDGSLQALNGALRHLADADEHELAQALLGETLHNHTASAQILWRLPLVLALGTPERPADSGGPDLAAFEAEVEGLMRAGRLDEAIGRVAATLGQRDCPALYELLGRLHLRRAAGQSPAPSAPAPAAPAPAVARDPAPVVTPTVSEEARPVAAPQPESAPVAGGKSEAEAVAPTRKIAEALLRARAEAQAQALRQAPSEPAKPRVEPEARPAPSAAGERTMTSSDVRPAPRVPTPAATPAPAAEKKSTEPASWVAEELLKARARAQEARREASEQAPAKVEAVAKPVPTAVEPEAAPPAADESKEEVFARLRGGFAKLGKVERKVLAWVMANPSQNAAQIARGTELSNAEVASALKGLTGLWLDPFTFAGYTVRDYVMECMSKGKQAPGKAKPATPAASKASRSAAQPVARALATPSTAAPATRAEPAPRPAPAAKPVRTTPAPALSADISALDLRVLQYIGSHPGCTPDEVMEAMGPDEPASVSLVTLRRDWLDRDVGGRYRIKPDMLACIPSGDRPLPSAPAEVEVEAEVAPVAPSRPRPSEPSLLSATSAPAVAPKSKEAVRLAKLPKGQRQILEFLRDNTQARTKDIARALEQDAAGVNRALLGPLGEHVSVVHSFWRLNDGVRDTLEALETAEVS